MAHLNEKPITSIYSIKLYYQGEPMSQNMYEKASKSEAELEIAREQANHCIPMKEDNSQ